MKKTANNNLRLGIFVTISILLFVAAIYFIGQRQQLFASTFHISGIFKDINGLQIGNNVRYSGINIGTIESIQQITDTTVEVGMTINNSTKKYIKKNIKASIGSDGLMGNKLIILIPGKYIKNEIADNDTVATVMPIKTEEILQGLKKSADNAALITSDLAVILNNTRNGNGAIGKLLMDSTLALNLEQTLINIKQGSGGFKQNMDAASHNVLLRGYLKKKNKAQTK